MYINKDSTKTINLTSLIGTIGKENINIIQTDKVLDFSKAQKLDSNNTKKDTVKIKLHRLFGEIKQDKDILYFYPWPYKDIEKYKRINKFLLKNTFFFKMKPYNVIGVKFRSYHYGAMTLPIKVYTSTKSDTLKNNIVFGANINAMIGLKWGKKKFYYLPNQKEGQSYETAISLNLVLGISQLSIEGKNTTPKVKESYTVPAFSYGLSAGYQLKKTSLFIALGRDVPTSTYGDNWYFKNKLWIGFGLGLSLN